MNTKTILSTQVAVAVSLIAVSLFAFANFASAATYAYVDVNGEVKPVVADTWQQAIATAVNIHMHSGVKLLDSASDFDIVGNNVAGY